MADAPEIIDARGIRCPLPVLKTEKRLASGLRPGAVLVVLATDPMARIDIPLFCRRQGYACAEDRDGETLKFTISAMAPG